MKETTQSQYVFFEPTTPSDWEDKVRSCPPEPQAQPPSVCKIFQFDHYNQTKVEVPPNYTEISELVAAWDKDETRRLAMEEARKWLATKLYSDKGDTVHSLRLRKGWSQKMLANALNTSQPHVARIERGTENITVDTCRRLSDALGIDMNTLDQALRRQEAFAQSKRKTASHHG